LETLNGDSPDLSRGKHKASGGFLHGSPNERTAMASERSFSTVTILCRRRGLEISSPHTKLGTSWNKFMV
jgi:hypothetical protein